MCGVSSNQVKQHFLSHVPKGWAEDIVVAMSVHLYHFQVRGSFSVLKDTIMFVLLGGIQQIFLAGEHWLMVAQTSHEVFAHLYLV